MKKVIISSLINKENKVEIDFNKDEPFSIEIEGVESKAIYRERFVIDNLLKRLTSTGWTKKQNIEMKFLTEFEKEDGMYSGHVFAETWEEAEKLAKQKGESVIGYIPPDCLDCESFGGTFNNQTF